VALELSTHFLLFGDDGVDRHPLDADYRVIPKRTWALSKSNDRTLQPCVTFLGAVARKYARIIQATSSAEERWQRYHSPNIFVMKYFSIGELKVPGLVRHVFYNCSLLAEPFPTVRCSISTPTISDVITKRGVLLRALACGYYGIPLGNTSMNRM
jgi:hypothetical protein